MENEGHKELLDGLKDHLTTVLESSAQGVYVYLDDDHKFCNSKFAHLLGYPSADAWASTEGGFLESFVEEGSQADLSGTYMSAMEDKIASHIDVVWTRKDGTNVKSSVILVPISYGGAMFALHFIVG